MNSTKQIQLHTAIPQLPAMDLAATKEYFDKIGFVVFAEYEGFVILKRDGVELHFWQCDNEIIPQNSSCYIRVAGIEEIFAECERANATVQERLEVKPWGMKQFALLDPSGNAIRFGEPA